MLANRKGPPPAPPGEGGGSTNGGGSIVARKGPPPPPPATSGGSDQAVARKGPPPAPPAATGTSNDDEAKDAAPPPPLQDVGDDDEKKEPKEVGSASGWSASSLPPSPGSHEDEDDEGGGGGGGSKASVVLVDGVPIVSLSVGELDVALASRSLECTGTIDEKRAVLRAHERRRQKQQPSRQQAGVGVVGGGGDGGGGSSSSGPSSSSSAAARVEYPVDILAAGTADGDTVLREGTLRKKATSGKFFSSLAPPQRRHFVLAARHRRELNACEFVLTYSKKQGGNAINSFIIDGACTLQDLTAPTAPAADDAEQSKKKKPAATPAKRETDTFLLTHIHGHPKTRLLARAEDRADFEEWFALLRSILDGSLERKIFASMRARSDVLQFQALVQEMLLTASGGDRELDEFYRRVRDAFSEVDWGADSVEYEGKTLDPVAQVATIKKIVSSMKQHEAALGEVAAEATQRRERRQSVTRRKSARHSRNTFST